MKRFLIHALSALALAALTAACSGPRPAHPHCPCPAPDTVACAAHRPTPAGLRSALLGVRSQEQREIWSRAYRYGWLPDPALIPPLREEAVQRERPSVAVSERPPGPPHFPATGGADVQVWCAAPIHDFRGAFKVTVVEPTRIAGTVGEPPEDFEIRYRFPQGHDPAAFASRLGTPPLTLNVDWNEDFSERSQHCRVQVWRAGAEPNEPLLFFASDGGRVDSFVGCWPLKMTTGGPKLHVAQADDLGGGLRAVRVLVDGSAEFTLAPGGAPQRFTGYPGNHYAYVPASASLPPERRLAAEGDFSHVVLMFWYEPVTY